MLAFGPPTISPTKFTAVLSQAGSPVLKEAPAADYYSAIIGYGLDPAFMLAIFAQESNFGTNPEAIVCRYATKNWGNTRSLSLPGNVPVYVDTERGRFVKFAAWLEGLHDACYRLVSPAYPYAAATAKTVETILPLWAPGYDRDNRPNAYIAAVLALMAGWKDIAPVAPTLYADRFDILPPGDNRDGRRLTGFHAFVIHETANENAGAGAKNTCSYLKGTYNNGVRPDASFHFVTDATEAVQILPAAPGDAEVGYHIGDGADQPDDEAFFTVAGEICVNSRGGYAVACRRMARVAAKVIKAHGKNVVDGVTLRQHGSYYSARNPAVHQGCPQHLKAADWGISWAQFVDMVQQEYAALSVSDKAGLSVDEAGALKAYGDGIAFEYRGQLVREGEADLSQFGGSIAERVCFYERLVTHRLKGASYVMTLAVFAALKVAGKLHAYPDMPY